MKNNDDCRIDRSASRFALCCIVLRSMLMRRVGGASRIRSGLVLTVPYNLNEVDYQELKESTME